MITIRDIAKAWSRLQKHERIRATLFILGMSREDAVEACDDDVSLPSVNMALSTGDRKPTLERLELMLKDKLNSIS